ncbi:zinc-ribbon domain-containing protein [Methyloversatilis discipulorum]|uniref:zinc-ribbon domain-containing protein n=1 Tax=Methyloversatilis discipulorum TaxID=1119528 RepID=UPI001A63797E|nr:zinc-ribbon domain-containing protein [Methyloversatilis discipulorum]MBL8469782.1 DUF805 domain-containing protein [Methyloversatilis discipulorum]
MKCPKCGHDNPAGVASCSACGANLDPFAAAAVPAAGGTGTMSFGTAISTCLRKYADFDGRATRAEYWWFYLFFLLVAWGAAIIDGSGTLSGLLNLLLLLPSLAAAARRLHDTGRSGWWQLIGFTIIGLIPLIYWLASRGSDGENEYGPPA